MFDNNEMGWKLLNSELLSFLWRGMTLAFLKASGKVPVEKIKLNISVRVYDNIFWMLWEFW